MGVAYGGASWRWQSRATAGERRARSSGFIMYHYTGPRRAVCTACVVCAAVNNWASPSQRERTTSRARRVFPPRIIHPGRRSRCRRRRSLCVHPRVPVVSPHYRHHHRRRVVNNEEGEEVVVEEEDEVQV